MRIQKILPVTCVMLALSVPAWAQATRFDFDYKTTDQRVQVFDDGKVTRIQLPENTPDPTLLAVEPKGEVLLKYTRESPNLVVNGIYSRIVMRWGNRREIQAVYTGQTKQVNERAGNSVSFGTVAPEASYGAVAKPVPVALTVKSNTEQVALADIPRVSAAMPAAEAAAQAVAAVTSGQIVVTPVVPAKVNVEKPAIIEATPSQTWQIDVKDVTLATTFNRWANAAGQKVRWDADRHILVEAPDSLVGSFEDAVTRVLSSAGIAQSTYPLEVCFYPNNPPLARITRKGEQKDCN